ncbi:hypothetical protein [Pseudoalteromonas rubra]|nr:hypothetical protein [Pseudoalteromonas rubra]
MQVRATETTSIVVSVACLFLALAQQPERNQIHAGATQSDEAIIYAI